MELLLGTVPGSKGNEDGTKNEKRETVSKGKAEKGEKEKEILLTLLENSI